MLSGLRHVVEVAAEQRFDPLWVGGEERQGVLDRADQVIERGEIAIVRGPALGGAPEELDGVVVRRVAGQVGDVQPVGMPGKARLDGGGAVVGGPSCTRKSGAVVCASTHSRKAIEVSPLNFPSRPR